MSATRLLVLGVVRIFQPAHGYAVRRELLTWGVEGWANVNPGSIYNALRTLTREGHLEELGTEADGGRPARTTYRLTMDGENEFAGLLSRALWEVSERDPSLLLAGLAFLPTLSRADAAEALEARETALDLQIRGVESTTRLLVERRSVPPHTQELFAATLGRLRGERDWARGARRRVADGWYRFAGEPGADEGPVDGRWFAAVEYPGDADRAGETRPPRRVDNP